MNQLKFTTFLVLVICFASCSSSDEKSGANENWETHSADGIKKESTNAKSSTNKNLDLSSDVSKKMYQEYGAMFFAKNGAIPPNKVVFANESEVSNWQSSIPKSVEGINGIPVELQKPAMASLLQAIAEAEKKGVSITPRGTDAAKRNYQGTVSLWNSRVNPNLDYWTKNGRLDNAEAERIKSLPIPQQISEIFKLEGQGMFFSTDRSKSIIYSVAPPGTSQHISMLALDVNEHENPIVRQILANHGWFQTVVSDAPHFTYLGAKESQLSQLGLKRTVNGNRAYWIPNSN